MTKFNWRQERARANAICHLVDEAIRQGYPDTSEGYWLMKMAREWMEDNLKAKAGKYDLP